MEATKKTKEKDFITLKTQLKASDQRVIPPYLQRVSQKRGMKFRVFHNK